MPVKTTPVRHSMEIVPNRMGYWHIYCSCGTTGGMGFTTHTAAERAARQHFKDVGVE